VRRDAVFLDANVLFSAAYRPGAGLLRLWELPEVRLITSAYALEEARRNLSDAEQLARLVSLTNRLEILVEESDEALPQQAALPAKDRPILGAAIRAGATYLLTGDIHHFGEYFGRTLGGVQVLPPIDYLGAYKRGEG
jgi:uncharacterized protein